MREIGEQKPDHEYALHSIAFLGKVAIFGLQVVRDCFRPPIEVDMILFQLAEVGAESLNLIVAAGFALGAIMTFHTRSTLVTFGATAMIPIVQALAR